MKFDIYSFDLAEALFYYFSIPDIYDNYCECLMTNGDISFAEYVELFKLKDFKAFCISEFGFEFEN